MKKYGFVFAMLLVIGMAYALPTDIQVRQTDFFTELLNSILNVKFITEIGKPIYYPGEAAVITAQHTLKRDCDYPQAVGVVLNPSRSIEKIVARSVSTIFTTHFQAGTTFRTELIYQIPPSETRYGDWNIQTFITCKPTDPYAITVNNIGDVGASEYSGNFFQLAPTTVPRCDQVYVGSPYCDATSGNILSQYRTGKVTSSGTCEIDQTLVKPCSYGCSVDMCNEAPSTTTTAGPGGTTTTTLKTGGGGDNTLIIAIIIISLAIMLGKGVLYK